MLRYIAALLEVVGFFVLILAAVAAGFHSPYVYIGAGMIGAGWLVAMVAQNRR